MSDSQRKTEIAEQLQAISEELTDLAVANLKDAVREGPNEEAKVEEKQLARARRAVDKAVGILQGRG